VLALTQPLRFTVVAAIAPQIAGFKSNTTDINPNPHRICRVTIQRDLDPRHGRSFRHPEPNPAPVGAQHAAPQVRTISTFVDGFSSLQWARFSVTSILATVARPSTRTQSRRPYGRSTAAPHVRTISTVANVLVVV
jgi:hypothetical protein